MTEKQQLTKIMKELRTAEYIGEDGGMVVNCPTLIGAYRKMRQRWIEDCGESDWQDFNEDVDLMENIGTAWLHLATKEDQDRFGEDVEWYVSLEKKSNYRVWCYWG